MQIVHVVRQFSPGIGGLESFVAQLASQQVAAGHDVRVITLDSIFGNDGIRLPHEDGVDHVVIRRLRWWGSQRYPIAPGLLGAIGKPDIVHVHALDWFHDMLALTKPLHRRTLVFSTHGLFFHTPYAGVTKLFWFATVTRMLTCGYAAVLASSAQDASRFATIRRHGLVEIENGVDLDRFAGLAEGATKRIIYFGRLAPNKGVDRLLAWFAALAARDPEWRLVIAGKPMGIDFATLRADVQTRGLDDRVTLHDTPDDALLRALIAQSSVYACASTYEGFGLAAIEAASAGLFLALSPLPPFRRNLLRIGCGTILDFDDPDGSALFLNAWQARGSAPDAASLNAAFGWPKVAARIEDAYERATGRTFRRIGSISVSVLGKTEATQRVATMITERRGGTVAFANHHLINMVRKKPDVINMLRDALVLTDGVAIDVASRILYGSAFPQNLNGSDFLPVLLSELPPSRIFLLGSKQGVAEQARDAMALQWPRHHFVGTHHGFPTDDQSATLVDTINRLDVDLLIVGMGNPYQEEWVTRYGSSLRAVCLCGGALLDRSAGLVDRGPEWLRKWRLEWIYRLVREPRRMGKRYIGGGFLFLLHVAKQKISGYRL